MLVIIFNSHLKESVMLQL